MLRFAIEKKNASFLALETGISLCWKQKVPYRAISKWVTYIDYARTRELLKSHRINARNKNLYSQLENIYQIGIVRVQSVSSWALLFIKRLFLKIYFSDLFRRDSDRLGDIAQEWWCRANFSISCDTGNRLHRRNLHYASRVCKQAARIRRKRSVHLPMNTISWITIFEISKQTFTVRYFGKTRPKDNFKIRSATAPAYFARANFHVCLTGISLTLK